MRVLSHRTTAVTLFSDLGECRAFDSRASALRELGASFIRHQVGPQFRTSCHYVGPNGAVHHSVKIASYVLRDDLGQPMGLEDFADLLPPEDPLYRFRWERWAVPTWNGEGPVPGTGRRGNYGYHRRPRTQAERRLNQFLDSDVEDGAPRVRAKRSAHNLPDAWDDLNRPLERRSWKAYRRTQYKRIADLGGAPLAHDGAPENGPTLSAFLDLLARDLDAHPERAVPLTRGMFERAQALLRDVEVNLDLPLPEAV